MALAISDEKVLFYNNVPEGMRSHSVTHLLLYVTHCCDVLMCLLDGCLRQRPQSEHRQAHSLKAKNKGFNCSVCYISALMDVPKGIPTLHGSCTSKGVQTRAMMGVPLSQS